MKIAALATSLVPSSTANSIQVMKACQALAQAGHEVCLWVPGRAAAPWEALAERYGLETRFEVRWIPAPLVFRRYDFTLRALLQARAWGAQALYTWALQAALPGLWLGWPTLIELHGPPTGKLGPRLFRGFMHSPKPKRLLLITQALRQQLEAAYGLPLQGSDVQIAPNATDRAQYAQLPDAPTARAQLGLPQGLTVGYTGHFYAGRGMNLLFELARRFPQLNFLWVGGNPRDVDAWRERLSAAQLNHVTLTGFVPQRALPLYQAAADILLMPYERKIAGSSGGDSASICSPMKMFDYLAAGRAILTSDLPVLHEVLNPRNAVFCPPEDVDGWAAALSALIEDPQRIAALSRQARADSEPYTWLARAQRALAGLPLEGR